MGSRDKCDESGLGLEAIDASETLEVDVSSAFGVDVMFWKASEDVSVELHRVCEGWRRWLE